MYKVKKTNYVYFNSLIATTPENECYHIRQTFGLLSALKLSNLFDALLVSG